MESDEKSKEPIGGKQRLLAAAHALFHKGEYATTSVDQLLALGQVKAPTLYHHFQDKEGLYTAWALEVLGALRADMLAATVAGEELAAQLSAYARILMHGESPDILRIRRDLKQLRRSTSVEPLYNGLYEAVYEPIFSVLIYHQVNGTLGEEPVDRMAHAFVLGSMSMHPEYAMQPISIDEAAQWWSRCFLQGTLSKEADLPAVF